MATNELQLKKRIMRRVYFIYFLKKVFSLQGLKLMVLALFLAEISPFMHLLSLDSIIANMPPLYDIRQLINFHEAAFLNTQPIIQISLIAVIFVVGSYAYTFLRRLSESLAGSDSFRNSALR